MDGQVYPAREGYLLVRHKTGIHRASIDSIHRMANAQVAKRFEFPEGLELVKVADSAQMMNSISIYQQNNDILYAEPDYMWNALDVPNDRYFSRQWALQNLGQTGGSVGADINVLPAWTFTTGNHNIVLGTIDTGVDYNHLDLVHNIWTNSLEIPNNGIDDDGNGFIDDVHGINAITGTGNPMDDHLHGTHVAGIMAAEQNNGMGVSGVAPNVSVVACKFLDASGSGDTAGAITCLNYFRALSMRSRDPVHIVATNNSWGGGPFSQALQDAIKAHQDQGILFMAAAGNDAQNNDRSPSYPSNYYLPNLISVAATDHNDKLASFSNYGRASVSIAAPGVNILSTVPSNQLDYLSGTSMATPHVTALAGLLASYGPNLSWIQIKNLILAGGAPIAAASKTTATGRRILAYGANGFGSLSCLNKVVSARAQPVASNITVRVRQAVPLAILNINCANPSSNPQVIVQNGTASTSVILNDNGKVYDQFAGDGIFSGYWYSDTRGTFTLRYPGSDIVTVTVR